MFPFRAAAAALATIMLVKVLVSVAVVRHGSAVSQVPRAGLLYRGREGPLVTAGKC